MKQTRIPTLIRNKKLTSILLVVVLTILASASGLLYPSVYSPAFFLGIVTVVVIAIAWLLKPAWALYVTLFVILLPAGSIPNATQSMLNRSLTIVAFGLWLLNMLMEKRSIFWNSSSLFMLAFVIWSMITMLWAENSSAAQTFFQLYALRLVVFLFLIPNEIRTKKDLNGLFLTLALSGWVFVGFTIAGLIQQGYTPGMRFKVLNVNENDSGLFMMMMMIGVWWWSSKFVPGNRFLKKVGAVIFFLLVLAIVALSGSRGSALSLAATLGVFCLWRSTRPWAILGVCLVLIGLVIFPSLFITTLERFSGATGDSLTLGGRDVIWVAARQMIIDHPLKGVGIGNASYDILKYLDVRLSKDSVSLHNPILVIQSETGFLGLLLYLSIPVSAVISFLYQYYRYYQSNPRGEFTLYFAIVASVFTGFMVSWFKGGGMETSYQYFLMLSLLLIPAGLNLNTFVQPANDKNSIPPSGDNIKVSALQ